MGKRKAEVPPVIESEPEPINLVTSLAKESLTLVPWLSVGLTAKEEGHQEEAPDVHLSAVRAEVEEETMPEGHPFWSMLALIGYETW